MFNSTFQLLSEYHEIDLIYSRTGYLHFSIKFSYLFSMVSSGKRIKLTTLHEVEINYYLILLFLILFTFYFT